MATYTKSNTRNGSTIVIESIHNDEVAKFIYTDENDDVISTFPINVNRLAEFISECGYNVSKKVEE